MALRTSSTKDENRRTHCVSHSGSCRPETAFTQREKVKTQNRKQTHGEVSNDHGSVVHVGGLRYGEVQLPRETNVAYLCFGESGSSRTIGVPQRRGLDSSEYQQMAEPVKQPSLLINKMEGNEKLVIRGFDRRYVYCTISPRPMVIFAVAASIIALQKPQQTHVMLKP